MPPAVAVPLAVAGLGMVSSNVQNKAAIKNNETQQASAVGNSQQAWQNASKGVSDWEAAHPSPFAGATVGGPTAGAYGPGGITGAWTSDGGGTAGMAGLIQQILSRMGQPQTGPPRQTQPVRRADPTAAMVGAGAPPQPSGPPAITQPRPLIPSPSRPAPAPGVDRTTGQLLQSILAGAM